MVPQYFGSLSTGVQMVNHDKDFGLLDGIDLPAYWETLKLRWWIVPTAVCVVVGVLWAQESDINIEPPSYKLTRVYEVRDPAMLFAVVGIEPTQVRSFPEPNNQLLRLQSASTRDEVTAKTGTDVTVSIDKHLPPGQTGFGLTLSAYSFSCIEPIPADCEKAIEAYAVIASDLRRDALVAGLNDLEKAFLILQNTAPDEGLQRKILALSRLKEQVDTPLLQVSEKVEAIGATVSSVSQRTYVFGAGAGLFLSLLLLLQLTFTDRRIRSLRKLMQLVDERQVLGYLAIESTETQYHQAAVSIFRHLHHEGTTSIRFLPLRSPLLSTDVINKLAKYVGTTFSISTPFVDISVAELATPVEGTVDVIAVRRNVDLKDDVIAAVAAMNRSSRTLAGVLLVD
jgi:hypothetical protein